jgi:hypothetical protein
MHACGSPCRSCTVSYCGSASGGQAGVRQCYMPQQPAAQAAHLAVRHELKLEVLMPVFARVAYVVSKVEVPRAGHGCHTAARARAARRRLPATSRSVTITRGCWQKAADKELRMRSDLVLVDCAAG